MNTFYRHNVRTLVVFAPNWLGDILFITPALAALKSHFPKAHLACIVPQRFQELLQGQSYLDEIIALDDRSLFEKIKLLFHLRQKNWDLGILFHRSKTRARLFQWANIRERWGYATNHRTCLLTRAISEPISSHHKMDHWLYLLHELGILTPHATYVYQSPASKFTPMDSVKKPYIVFHPGSNWKPKRWPTTYFAKLGTRLQKLHPYEIVISGSHHEKYLAREIQKYLKGAVVDLTGRTSLSQLAAIFLNAHYIIAGDTGPMHLASALGARVIALYGPTSPTLNGPRHPHSKVIYETSGDLLRLTPEIVFEEISNLEKIT
ncbi:MAG: glycosyltransferase family 9 protein [Deltaproteobacteria bacterium]|nr:glycosyltransferase family 9 protein [Deltaproteobacteria bacterium]